MTPECFTFKANVSQKDTWDLLNIIPTWRPLTHISNASQGKGKSRDKGWAYFKNRALKFDMFHFTLSFFFNKSLRGVLFQHSALLPRWAETKHETILTSFLCASSEFFRSLCKQWPAFVPICCNCVVCTRGYLLLFFILIFFLLTLPPPPTLGLVSLF